ncbi:MAG: AMP-binding protein, partial [Candidatus Margulisiibacteriota bacterium]
YHLLSNMKETKVTVLCGVPLLYSLFLDGIKRQVEEKGFAARILFRIFLCISAYFKVFLRMNIGKYLFGFIHKKFGPNIKFFVSGGAALDPEVIKDFDLMGFTMLQGYGLTETSPILAACTLENNVFGSVGKPLPGIEIKLHNINANGVGEIIAKGPNIMKGYYKNPEATAEAVRDGWFYTGDLGRFDKKGTLFITGRAKDLIVLGSGKNVYPDEIEFTMSKSPFIKEICVFGAKIKNGIRAGMEEVRAAILPDMDKMADWVTKNNTELNDGVVYEIIGREVESWGNLLTPHKRIAKYYIVGGELPKTATRKIKRFAVKDRYSE